MDNEIIYQYNTMIHSIKHNIKIILVVKKGKKIVQIWIHKDGNDYWHVLTTELGLVITGNTEKIYQIPQKILNILSDWLNNVINIEEAQEKLNTL